MQVDENWFTVQATVERGLAPEDTLLAAIHSGELEAVNVAKNPNGQRPRWRISESALAKWLLRRRHPASQQPATTKQAKRQQPKQYV